MHDLSLGTWLNLHSSGDNVETIGLGELVRGNTSVQLKLKVTTPAGEAREIPVAHTMSSDQLDWLKAGSALNFIGAKLAAAQAAQAAP